MKAAIFCVLLLGIGLLPGSGHASPNPGDIVLVAGNETAAYSGDGGPATAASFYSPQGVAVDGSGNIFIADMNNHVIRRVDAATKLVSTVVGISANLNKAVGVAVDSAGNLYIADGAAKVVLKVAPGGSVTTVAGTGVEGSVAEGPATTIGLSYPWGVAVDSAGNNLYIAEFTGGRVRKVSLSDGQMTTVTAGLNSPTGIAVDLAGNLYIAEYGGNKVRKWDASLKTLTVVAGSNLNAFGYNGDNIPAVSALLNVPLGVAVDPTGNIYIVDQGNARIRMVDAATKTIHTVAGGGTSPVNTDGFPANSSLLISPDAITVDTTGNIWVSDQANNSVSKIFAKVAPVVTASPVGGTYFTSQSVVLTSSVPATIYYTLDGSLPTPSSAQFSTTGTVHVGSTATLKYYALDSVGDASSVVSQDYTIVVATAPLTAPGPIGADPGNGQTYFGFIQLPADPIFTGGSPITGYIVTSIPAGGVDNNAGSPLTPHLITGLVNGTTYRFTVAAINAVGTGPSSSPAPVAGFIPLGPPTAPTAVSAIAGDGRVTVYFKAPSSNGGYTITNYTVTSSPDSVVGTGTGSPIVVTGLTNGIAYKFTVTADNFLGTGPSSPASASATPVQTLALCHAAGSVTIDDVQSAVNMFLGTAAVTACVDVDPDTVGWVTVSEVQKVINAFLAPAP